MAGKHNNLGVCGSKLILHDNLICTWLLDFESSLVTTLFHGVYVSHCIHANTTPK